MKYRLGDARVETHPDSWIAPSAAVIGKVRLDAGASVWFGAVLRGDNEPDPYRRAQQRPGRLGDAHRHGLSADPRQGRHRRPQRHAAWLQRGRLQPGRDQRGDPQWGEDRQVLHHRRQRADSRGQGDSRRLAGDGLAGQGSARAERAAKKMLEASAAHYVHNARRYARDLVEDPA